MEDLIIMAFFVWICLVILGYSQKNWELQALNSLLGFYLAVYSLDLSFIFGLFMFGSNLWILFEALQQAK